MKMDIFNISNQLTPIELLDNNYLIPNEESDITAVKKIRYIKENKSWVSPFFMEPINKKVVYRSKHLLESNGSPYQYDEHFTYQESMSISNKGSKLSSYLTGTALNTFEYLFSKKWGQKVISTFAPAPGEGPSETQINKGHFDVHIIAKDNQDQSVELNIIGHGDPSNKCTANLMLSCLDILIQKEPTPAGFQTPASAFGPSLVDKMNQHNFSFKGI